MTTDIDTAPTPTEVARHATRSATLDRLALIGTFGSDTAPGALIRHPDGKVQRIKPGDTVGRDTVSAIDADRVLLTRGTTTRTLALPAT